MTSIRIVVSQSIIDATGRGRNGSSCPVAKAIKRSRKAMKALGVSVAYIHVTRDAVTKRGDFATDIPIEARSFIAKYDAGNPVRPFAFILNVPS